MATVGRLLGQLFPVTGDLHEAEEVVQEAFARASTRWSRIRDYDVPEAWVRRVAMNLAADRDRRLQRQAGRCSGPGRRPRAAGVGRGPGPGRRARTLPIHQRQAIVLHYLVDLPVEEVAATLGTRAGTVKSWLARGRRTLAHGSANPRRWADDRPARAPPGAGRRRRPPRLHPGPAAAVHRGRQRRRRIAGVAAARSWPSRWPSAAGSRGQLVGSSDLPASRTRRPPCRPCRGRARIPGTGPPLRPMRPQLRQLAAEVTACPGGAHRGRT